MYTNKTKKMKYLRIKIPGDGNCMFTAVAAAQEGRAGLAKGWHYRQMTADYITKLVDKSGWTPSEAQFVQHMLYEVSDPEFRRMLTNLHRDDEDRRESRISNTDLRFHKGVVLEAPSRITPSVPSVLNFILPKFLKRQTRALKPFLLSYATVLRSSRRMYGGGIELRVLAEILKRDIVVHRLTPEEQQKETKNRNLRTSDRILNGRTQLMQSHGGSHIVPISHANKNFQLSNSLRIHLALNVDGFHYDLLIPLLGKDKMNSKLLALELQAEEYKHIFNGHRLTPSQLNGLHRRIFSWAHGIDNNVPGVNHRLNYVWWRNDPAKNNAFWAAAWNIMQQQR